MINLLTAPIFDDEDKTMVARHLFIISWTLMAVGWLPLIMAVFIPETAYRWLLVTGYIESAALILFVLNKYGHTRSAKYFLIFTVWAAATGMALTGGGIHSNAMSLYLITVLVAGLVQRGKTGFITAVLCSLTGLFLFYLEYSGALPTNKVSHTPFTEWIASTIYMFIIISFQYLVSRTIREALNQSRQELKERKRIDEALRESEERYKALFDRSLDCVYVHDFAGNFIDANDAALNLLGYKREELPSLNFAALLSDDQMPRALQALQEILDNGFQKNMTGYRMKRKNGDSVYVETIASSILHEGIPYAIQGIARDITGRKQAEAYKEMMEKQNRQLQKSESLGRMAAAIAHHFNNRLGVVIGNLEMAMKELPKGASTHQTLTKAMQSAWTAADMSNLMLTYLGQTHDKREPLDLSYSCRKILPILEAAMPENVILETDFSSPGPVINSNPDYMQQTLTNLLTNAWEAIGKKTGSISLSVKTVSPAEIPTAHRFPIDWQPQDSTYACLEVTDTGSGIEDKDIEKLFDPFFTDKFTGLGMGLPVVFGIVNSHKGVITIDSKPGRGSTFRIFFPLSEEALPQPQTAENDRNVTISSPSPGKMEEGGTVLVIEDEEVLRTMTGTMLESFGFSVLQAKDGVEALEVFGKHQSEIKFVISDLTMPRMNGWETLTALRKLQPDIPVILASGYDKAHVMEGDHPELPQAFLAKPYNLKALRAAISRALEIA